MFAMYHPDENEYVGVEITHDECNGPHHILTPYSDLESDAPYLFATKTREEAQSILDIAQNHYQGEIPVGACIIDYSCAIPNLASYVVVEMLPYFSS